VFNAAIGVHHLGAPVRLLAAVGGDPVGRIEEEFDAMGLPYRWVATQAATRVCTTILDEATGAMTELVENGRPLVAGELDAFREAYADEAAAARVAILTARWPSARLARWCSTSAARSFWPCWTSSLTWSSRTATSWPERSAARWTKTKTSWRRCAS
jgi:fructose-1-phosphate kinase PfkB-like protein